MVTPHLLYLQHGRSEQVGNSGKSGAVASTAIKVFPTLERERREMRVRNPPLKHKSSGFRTPSGGKGPRKGVGPRRARETEQLFCEGSNGNAEETKAENSSLGCYKKHQ